MQQVTVSRKVAGIILAGCLALGVLVGVASNFSKQSMTGLRGSTAEAASVGRRLTVSSHLIFPCQKHQQTFLQPCLLTR